MSTTSASKGKKRARDEDTLEASTSELSELSASPEPAPRPATKSKRAQTKLCPVCNEAIPLRLLPAHAELEMERVQSIIGAIGSTDILEECEPIDGSSSRDRRSAVRARQSLTLLATSARTADPHDATALMAKTVQGIQRRRKRRHAALRELARDEDVKVRRFGAGVGGEGTVCPVCLQTVRGDVDVVDAHVDACLVHAAGGAEEEEDVDVEDDGVLRATDGMNLRGAGFHERPDAPDVDVDIDVDGDDEALFGDVQFTERDILTSTFSSAAFTGPSTTNMDGNEQQRTLRDLVAEGKVLRKPSAKRDIDAVLGLADTDRVDGAIAAARLHRADDPQALVEALENKVAQLESTRVSSSTSLLCRICLDPYAEPTVSTGCWHTCCRECWLRCLGSTKLCPICKRITGATELRRVYL